MRLLRPFHPCVEGGGAPSVVIVLCRCVALDSPKALAVHASGPWRGIDLGSHGRQRQAEQGLRKEALGSTSRQQRRLRTAEPSRRNLLMCPSDALPTTRCCITERVDSPDVGVFAERHRSVEKERRICPCIRFRELFRARAPAPPRRLSFETAGWRCSVE